MKESWEIKTIFSIFVEVDVGLKLGVLVVDSLYLSVMVVNL